MAVNLHEPAICAGGFVPLLRPDPQIAVTDCYRRHHAEVGPLAQIAAVEVESLQAAVLPVSYVYDAVGIHGDSVRLMELSWTSSGAAPLAQPLAIGGVFQDARIAVSIGDEEVAVGSEGNVGGPVEAALGGRLPTYGNLHQLLTHRCEFVHHRTGGVDCPDVSLGIDADGVRDVEHALTPGPQHLSIAIHDDHWIGVPTNWRAVRFLVSLEEIDQTTIIHCH